MSVSQPTAAGRGERPANFERRATQIATAHAARGSGPSQLHHATVSINSSPPTAATAICAGVYGPSGI
ncbi:hypothetical protein ACFWXK_10345 [Streptomyces sp. NPDC059070]|uniref:hypothetical protein n=1 Tax=Streptomyces sp. NPDC059070 TaxID=3346713 RepID=UPI0036A7E17B